MASVVNTNISPQHARAAATHVVRVLRDARTAGGDKGHAAYFAGGCVRDELLGLHPSDYDVATDARPEQIRKLFPRTAAVGAAFGVMLVHVDESQLAELVISPGASPTPLPRPGMPGVTVEVATFRSDGSYTDARRPDSVQFSTDREDAARRDFTINALFLDPLDAARDVQDGGRVIDYVAGRDDLAKKIVRAVGDADARLSEDHLRALRAVRFAARLGFDIDPATADAIRRHAAELRGVSRERIGDELRRMMSSSSRADAVRWLRALNLEHPALGLRFPPGKLETRRLTSLGHANELLPALYAFGRLSAPSFAACLAAWWLDGIDDDPAKRNEAEIKSVVSCLRGSLCLSNAETEELGAVLRTHSAVVGSPEERGGWEGMTVARQRRTAGGGAGGGTKAFAAACAMLSAVDPDKAEAIAAQAAALAADAIGLNPTPLVLGDDLIAMGMKPGPDFKRILDGVYDAQLEGKISTPEAARELAGRLGV